MPKFTLPLVQINPEDVTEIGETSASLANFNHNQLKVPAGFVLNHKVLEAVLVETDNQVVLGNSDTQALAELLKHRLVIPDELDLEINNQLKKLDFPILITTYCSSKGKSELQTFEALVTSKKEFHLTLKQALLSFANPQTLTDNLASIKLAIRVMEKPAAEISGKVVTAPGHNGSIKIYAQWGEFYKETTSDLATLTKTREQTYNIANQEKQIVWQAGKFRQIQVPKKYQFTPKLNPKQTEELFNISEKLESTLRVNFEFAFAYSENKLYLSNLLVNSEIDSVVEDGKFTFPLPFLAQLQPIFPGIVSGTTRFLQTDKDFRQLRRGEIAALKTFNKRYIPKLKKSSGIILENSKDITIEHLSHLKSLGKATVLGQIDKATKKMITIDGKSGKVYLGTFPPPYIRTFKPTFNTEFSIRIKSATSLFVETKTGADIVKLDQDSYSGVIVELSEHLLTLGHPRDLTARQLQDSLNKTKAVLSKVAQNNPDKPVIFTLSSFSQGQLPNEQIQKRYHYFIHIIKEELALVKNLRNRDFLKNIWLLLPAVTSTDEFEQVKTLLSQAELTKSPTLKIFFNLKLPAQAMSFANYLDKGVDGVLIDYYDLVSLTHGKDFTATELSNFTDQSTLDLIATVLQQAKEKRLFSAISCLPISKDSQALDKIVSLGVNAIVTKPSEVETISVNLNQSETKMLTGA